MLIGYARVSTDDKNLEQQRAALKAAGCKRIFEEKVSGTKRDRPQLAMLLGQLRSGDVVTITRLDRLARSTRDLLDIAERLEAAEAGLRSLAEPWVDTTSPAGRMVLMALLQISILVMMAEGWGADYLAVWRFSRCWASNAAASVNALGPMLNARSTMRASPRTSPVRLKIAACPLRRARITSKPLIVA